MVQRVTQQSVTADEETVTPLAGRNQSDSYTPSDLASLYRIPSDLEPTDTIGIVDVGSDPNTQKQMTYFRTNFRLPACTTANGCFREVGQDGSSRLPATNSDWVTEIAIDVQAVTAICRRATSCSSTRTPPGSPTWPRRR